MINDPTQMTASARLDELARLLARAVQRQLVAQRKRQFEPRNSQVRLDDEPDGEAPCRTRVQSPQSRIA